MTTKIGSKDTKRVPFFWYVLYVCEILHGSTCDREGLCTWVDVLHAEPGPLCVTSDPLALFCLFSLH